MLQAALLISDREGEPLAPLYLGLEAGDRIHSTRPLTPLRSRPEIDEINRTMGYVEQQLPGQAVVQVIDREADSILHMRRFARCGRRCLIRGNDVRRVRHEGQSRLLLEVEADLEDQLRFTREVLFKGKAARQYVAETAVTLGGPARQVRQRQGKRCRREFWGRPLSVRLIIARARDKEGKELARWRLWSKMWGEVSAAQLSLWYYWRWRVESLFKLRKRAGQHLERWQQESGLAIARR